ncbi:MAG: hypothetical protein DI598_14050 [Pseudopedobacter saltans]|uniref:Terminase ATPase subunit N-terminal domain-containing protein n=1 Tax=Pseudopedobacter saltans TaxID=151895 RepID=A0A2W5GNP7_9SPHI|nr:MAG: hypothetical protein DI598_14050 [Pseudopedobacter saltans]
MSVMKKTEQQLDQAKTRAKKLFQKGELNQKEIAQELDISENTMNRWVRKYNWRKHKEREFYESDNYLFSFLRYLREEQPDTYSEMLATFGAFVDRKKNMMRQKSYHDAFFR